MRREQVRRAVTRALWIWVIYIVLAVLAEGADPHTQYAHFRAELDTVIPTAARPSFDIPRVHPLCTCEMYAVRSA